MLVTGRDQTGTWVTWRVGRRRLAWRPRAYGFHAAADASDLTVIIIAVCLIPYVVNWIAALTATVVVWPWRSLTGRWPVIAYSTTSDGPTHQFNSSSRAEASEHIQRWAGNIKRLGTPTVDP